MTLLAHSGPLKWWVSAGKKAGLRELPDKPENRESNESGAELFQMAGQMAQGLTHSAGKGEELSLDPQVKTG